jgi:hypothetical protein
MKLTVSVDPPSGIPPESSFGQQCVSRYHTLILTANRMGLYKIAAARVSDFSYHPVPFSETPAIARYFVSD